MILAVSKGGIPMKVTTNVKAGGDPIIIGGGGG
jgi:hypothetical protein